jgi:hypothetical protein
MVANKRSQGLAAEDSDNHDAMDTNPEAHAAFLLARIARDLQGFDEPIDLSTVLSARQALGRLDNLLTTLNSHRRAASALTARLQEKKYVRKETRSFRQSF